MIFTDRPLKTTPIELPVNVYTHVDNDGDCVIRASNGEIDAKIGYIDKNGCFQAWALDSTELSKLGFKIDGRGCIMMEEYDH